jgi:hypothetical protein
MIAWHSPDEVLETGLLGCLRRKRLQSLPAAMSKTLSPVRFESKSCGIALPFPAISGAILVDFLCTSDCVAEREGFAPSVGIDNT